MILLWRLASLSDQVFIFICIISRGFQAFSGSYSIIKYHMPIC